ncbi:non-ribosomal peptide synthetase, partial [Niastella yeongjuensis]
THGPDPQISFNYLGDFGDGTAAGSSNPLGELSGEPQGNRIGPDRQRETLLDITGITIGGKLRLSISYSNEQYNKSTIEELTRIYRQELEALIGELSITTTERLTPVDLTWKELSVAQWEVLNRDEQIEDVYPLSPLQEGLYYQWLMNPRAGAYFEQMCYGVQDELDLAQLAKSYELLVERHAVLRTCFSRELGERPLQLVKKTVANGFHYEDKTTDRDFSVEALRAADRSKGFDLHQGSQMRLTLIKLDQDRYEFVWSHHHILMDGWCVGILIKEFFEIYYSLQQSREAALPKVQPYARYIEWLGKQDREASLSYWKNYLSGYDTMSVLPKKETVANRAFLPQSVGFSLEESLRQSVRNICDELAITESSFIQAAWGILLSRYNNTSDVVFGAVVSGRPAELKGVEEMIGMFINTIPVRITINSTATVAALLKATQQASINNVGDRYLQLGEIQEALSPGRELFDHIILFQNFPVQQLVEESMPVGSKGNSLSMTSFKVFAQNNFDFTMMVNPARTFSIRFDYNGNIYAEDKVRQLQECLTQIIEQIVNDPSAAVKDITGLSDEERNKVLRSFNDIVPNYTGYQSVTALIEAEAVRHPENVAISFGSTAVSYRELNDQAGRLAAYLINNYGIGANDRIGILLDRSPLMIVGVLGVLKAGGAYVPIDPEYPRTRREYILQDAGVKVLLTQSDYIYDLDAYQGPIVAMDLQLSGITDAPVHSAATAGEALAYVIYTSGSTGNPKGCAITHGSLSNYIQWSNNYYFSNGKPASFGLFTSLSFDLTVTSIFCTLTQSGTLTVYPQTTALAEVLMHSFSAESSVNSIKLTPSHIGLMKYLTLSSDTMRRAIVGGEQLTAEQVDILKKIAPAIEIYNEYGPTETTVGCVVARIEQGERVVIGKPIAHTAIYILNEDNNPCGTDIPGEICIAGAGLAYGYLNNPELTAAKFVSNPYGAGERMYRTGDLGKWLPDGSLVFIGRRDDQVKIRGYRVEPGEIENVILKYESVDTAVVMVRSNNDEQELAAYIKAKSELDLSALKSWLLTRLPAWMLPAHLLQLDSLPLTVNGKIDRSKLPAPGAFNRLESQGHELPRNEIEEQLVQIWRELLGRARISITDNFFDVGGNSIRIVRLASLVSNLLGREISVALLFEYPSIKGLVDHIVQEPVPANEEVYEQEELITAFNKFNIEAHE